MLRILLVFMIFCVYILQIPEGICHVAKNESGKSISTNLPTKTNSFILSAGDDKELTCDQQVVSLDGMVDAIVANYSVEWTTDFGNFTSSPFVLQPEVNKAGNYYLEVTNLDNGDIMTDTVIVTKDDLLPTITVQPFGELNCRDSSVTVLFSWTRDPNSVISDYEIYWTTVLGEGAFDFGNSTINAGIIVMVKPSQYFFEIVDRRNGCSVIDTITVLGNYNEQVADAGGDQYITCAESVAVLRANTQTHPAGTQYLWSTDDGTLEGITILETITATSEGTYYLEVIDPDSHCSSFDTIQVFNDFLEPDIHIAAPATLNCNFNQITLDAEMSTQGSDWIYSWTTTNGNIISGDNTLSPLINGAGEYTLRIENQHSGCFSEETIEVFGNYDKTEPILLSVDTLNCTNNTAGVRLSNPQNPLVQYGWYNSNDQLISSFSDLTQTAVFQGGNLYVVSRHMISGCTDTTYFTVPVFDFQPVSNAGPNQNLDCSGLPVILNGGGSNMNANSIIEWLNEFDQVLSVGEITYSTLVAGVYKFRITDRMSKCSHVSSVTVTPDMNAPDISAGPGQTLTCDVRTIALQGEIMSSITNYEIEWTSPTGNLILGNPESLSPIVNTPGVYTLTVKDLDNQCPSSSNVVIEEDVEEPLAMAGDPINFNCDQEFITLVGQTNISNPSVRWTTFGGAFGGSTNSLTTSIIQPGIYTLTVRNPQTGCENSSFVIVRAPENFPNIDAGDNKILDCKNESILLNGQSSITNNISIDWTGPGNISNSGVFEPHVDAEGIYTLSVTNNQNNCTAIDSVMVEIQRDGPDSAEIIPFFHDCDNSNASILIGSVVGGKPPYQFEIEGLTDPSNNNIYHNLDAGFDYVINIIDDGGCLYTETVTIDSTAVPDIILNPGYSTTSLEGIELSPTLPDGFSGNLTYSWFPTEGLSCSDCLNPIANPTVTTHYRLTITAEDGCEAEFYTLVTVEEKENIYVPNAFSPNEDNINDRFTIFGDADYVESVLELHVFDRMGNVVYKGTNLPINDETIGWDGTFKSRQLAPAVFVYTAEILFKNGRRKIYSGDINLIR